jgi:hypothetical protein
MATFEFDISASTSVYNVDNNNPYIAFTGSNDFMSLDTNYTTLSGTLSLTTTNGRNSSSKNVKNITLLDTNNTEIGTITTNGINFEKGNTTTLPFSFSGVYNNREIGGMKISVGKDDGIDLYSFDINACGNNTINKVVGKRDRWIKDKTKTFTIDTSIKLSDCAKTNLTTGLYNNIGSDNTSFIISPKDNDGVVMAYLTDLSFNLSSNTNNISYVIYGSNTTDNFTEIIHSDELTNLGASKNDIEIDISYPKPFKHYKFLITSVGDITNIVITNITPTFEQYDVSGSKSLSNSLFREPHYEHFTNQRKFPDIIVPGILTLFFIGVLSLRK